jgi:hypothetical protein
METAPLANIVTLGVRDFVAERAFYLALRWPLVLDLEDFVVFELRGALLALFPIEQLAADARAKLEPHREGIRFSIIINADTPQDVDELARRFRDAGGAVTKEPVARRSLAAPLPLIHSVARVGFVVCTFFVLHRHAQVDPGGGQAFVPEELANGFEVDFVFGQMGGEGVAQGVRAGVPFNPADFVDVAENPPNMHR